jgi:hypothetical protein
VTGEHRRLFGEIKLDDVARGEKLEKGAMQKAEMPSGLADQDASRFGADVEQFFGAGQRIMSRQVQVLAQERNQRVLGPRLIEGDLLTVHQRAMGKAGQGIVLSLRREPRTACAGEGGLAALGRVLMQQQIGQPLIGRESIARQLGVGSPQGDQSPQQERDASECAECRVAIQVGHQRARLCLCGRLGLRFGRGGGPLFQMGEPPVRELLLLRLGEWRKLDPLPAVIKGRKPLEPEGADW